MISGSNNEVYSNLHACMYEGESVNRSQMEVKEL
jgi:hypothetical protein